MSIALFTSLYPSVKLSEGRLMIARDVHDCTRWTGNVLKMLRGPLDKALYADDTRSGSPPIGLAVGSGSKGVGANLKAGGSLVSVPSSAGGSVMMFPHPKVGSSFELA